MAVGQPTFITKSGDDSVASIRDGNYAWEGWYKFQVTDNISVTPAIYYLSAPLGQLTRYPGGGNFNNFGGLLKTTFRF
jgi:carbohydrate-selective porin OprB